MLYTLLRLLSILIFKLFFALKVEGRENLPQKGGFILASNHTSYLDPVILGTACPRKLDFMARDDLFKRHLFSRLILALGAFPVKRDSADRRALKEAIRRLKDNRGLVLFPEGTRQSAGRLGQPAAGIGFLSARSAVPVVPVFIRGSDRALPRQARFIRLHKISVSFGQQIFIERGMPYQEAALKIMEDIRRMGC